jgi:hypothetical protein
LSATHPHKLLKIQLANAPSPQNRLRVPVKVSMLNKGSAISINADTANGSGNSTNKNQAVHAVTQKNSREEPIDLTNPGG